RSQHGRARFPGGVDPGRGAPARAPLRAFFEQVEQRPEWLDEDLLAQGAAACHRSGLSGMRGLRDAALMAGYQASAINKTLVLTGSLARGAQRRVAETTKWWIDVTGFGGMDRFGPGFKATLQVRLLHATIRHRLAHSRQWHCDEWGLPVNQTDMAATQLGFSVVFLLASRALGVPLSAAEGRAVMHLWRYIGWLMGVAPHWLADTENQGRILLYHNLLAQAPPDESSKQLGRALMDEPLLRHYPNLAWLRGRFERARHLSICRLFMDRQSMRDLGLPASTLPWYPAAATPANFALQSAGCLLPGGRRLLQQRGRRAQVDYLEILFGQTQQRLASVQVGQ
ncbi:MAG: DUF2236 domain-containing protein, partial [Salinisphaera sp.]|nr:DUF2236 domain-containing protein [Salinisphaera sp.]